ncbi:hypothetical protein QQF64_020309 [Cirrhinus molitorella]|uniref:Uncharacterized protein n=1 Tax=Cirrhinus molitorella TaxID=172907 RepID=A0ABR3L8S9_9TELE
MSDEEAQASRENHAHASLPRRGQITPKDIPLPPPFRNDGTESFQLWARRYEIRQGDDEDMRKERRIYQPLFILT